MSTKTTDLRNSSYIAHTFICVRCGSMSWDAVFFPDPCLELPPDPDWDGSMPAPSHQRHQIEQMCPFPLGCFELRGHWHKEWAAHQRRYEEHLYISHPPAKEMAQSSWWMRLLNGFCARNG